jgi:DNA-binding SARP family transcriptional activator
MQLGVLGPLLIRHNGSTIHLPAARHRAVLAVLLVNANRAVPAGELADAVWDGAPPPAADVTVRGYIRRLRLLLGPEVGARIVTRPHGYMAEVTAGELDLLRFAELCRQGGAALRTGSWRRCSDALGEALRLWRDTPLLDVPCDRLQRDEVPRLNQMRLQAAEWRADAELHLGRPDLLIAELQDLAAQQPLRERFHALLMIALARCGRQAEALAAYQQARQSLIGELGVEPGPELRELHQQILQQNPDLLGPSPASATGSRVQALGLRGEQPEEFIAAGARRLAEFAGGAGAVMAVPSVAAGAEGAGRLGVRGGRAQFPGGTGKPKAVTGAAEAVSVAVFRRVCQLPPDIADFTGRQAECDRLAELLVSADETRAVAVAVVSGLAGVGKTSIALHVAHALRGRFPDGQLYVQLGGTSMSPRRPGEVLGEVLRALGVAVGSIPRETAARSALLRSCLADRRVLLVADDAASAAQVRTLLPGTAGCAAVITSRDRLAGLAASHLYLKSLPPGEAVEMLGRIAGEHRVAADPAAAAGLVAACGHLPLAVRIVGARLITRPSWPVATLAALMANERRRLDELSVGDLDVRAAIELSYQPLPARARRAFRLLALEGPSCFAAWVVQVLIGSGDTADIVDLLVGKSMLGAGGVDATGQPRYRLHDLLLDYAGQQLAGEPQRERAAAFERLLHAWLQLCQCADQAMPRNPYLPPVPGHLGKVVLPQHIAEDLTASPVAWFSSERLNLRHATARACDSGHLALALQLASRQAAFHHSQTRFDETEQLWRMVSTAATSASDKAVAAHAAFGLAVTRALEGYHAEVSGAIGQCAAAFEECGDQHALAWAMFWQATCAVMTGRHAEALTHSQRGIALTRKNHDPGAEIMLLREAAMALAGIQGRADEAIAYAKRALTLARRAGEETHELDTLRVLSHVNNFIGHHSAAEHIARQGIDLASERNYVTDQAYFNGALGDACHGLGKYHDAIDAFGRALPTFRTHRLRRHEALCLLKMAESHLALGNTQQANEYLVQCQPAFTELQMLAHAQRAQKALASMPTIDRPGHATSQWARQIPYSSCASAAIGTAIRSLAGVLCQARKATESGARDSNNSSTTMLSAILPRVVFSTAHLPPENGPDGDNTPRLGENFETCFRFSLARIPSRTALAPSRLKSMFAVARIASPVTGQPRAGEVRCDARAG